ncbi:hypothetical protein [Streptomyces sirii]|uniref:hypothetical protein n=1 Tax=Streptomyces sirii TaxID=3127701 RepID=UPI003D369EC8
MLVTFNRCASLSSTGLMHMQTAAVRHLLRVPRSAISDLIDILLDCAIVVGVALIATRSLLASLRGDTTAYLGSVRRWERRDCCTVTLLVWAAI